MQVLDTRTRIINAATELFNKAGIRGATLEAISAAAGVTKKTLYYHFRSKDDLISASLVEGDLNEFVQVKLSTGGRVPFAGLIQQMFEDLALGAANPYWQGCAFARAAFELAGMPGHPGVVAAKAHKSSLEKAFQQELSALGASEPNRLARRLMLLLDGAITHSVVHHDPEYAREAGELARELVLAAQNAGRSVRGEAGDVSPKRWQERLADKMHPLPVPATMHEPAAH